MKAQQNNNRHFLEQRLVQRFWGIVLCTKSNAQDASHKESKCCPVYRKPLHEMMYCWKPYYTLPTHGKCISQFTKESSFIHTLPGLQPKRILWKQALSGLNNNIFLRFGKCAFFLYCCELDRTIDITLTHSAKARGQQK